VSHGQRPGAGFKKEAIEASSTQGFPMSLSFLIGAVIGSGAFILLGRAPAQKLVEAVQARIGKPR
jgi:hypothetical protein